MRDSILISKLLINIEVWPHLSEAQIRKFEQTDLSFQKKLLKCPVSTNTEIVYSELNTILFKFLIMKRRLMYHWNILIRNSNELVSRVHRAMTLQPSKTDWCSQITKDKNCLEITLSDGDISSFLKERYKKYVSEKVKTRRLSFLRELQ